MALLSRRDERTQSDYIRVIVDSYHDKRTGYQFMVNPAGVKRDLYLYNDTNEDISWDAVWDVETSIDSLGWLAEFRIPLSQLRYPKKESHTFGVAVHREVGRTNERSSWPVWRRSQAGLASQLGEVQGITGISSPRRLEFMPYSVQSNASVARSGDFGRTQRGTFGADIKYGLSSNLTLDAAINPDFGQVEADPSVLNLSAFEQFFGEQRPFFLEGTGILRFDQDCNDGACTGLFYSRRIGRAPQLGFLSPDFNAVPTSSTILGAAKITGRLGNGMSLGSLNAVPAREMAGGELEVEPDNYFVARLNQDLRGAERHRRDSHRREPRSRRVSRAVPSERSVHRRYRCPSSVWSGRKLSAERERRRQPCSGIRGSHRGNAAQLGSLLPAPGRRSRVRFDAH
jgi:hypothetical protein